MATTSSAILERVETVLQAQPLSLTLSSNPSTDETVPNSLVAETVRVQSGGIVKDTEVSNFTVLRMERITVTTQRASGFEAYESQRDLQDLLDKIERAVIADGPDNNYFATVEKGSRKITRKKDSDVLEATISFVVDYDFSEVG